MSGTATDRIDPSQRIYILLGCGVFAFLVALGDSKWFGGVSLGFLYLPPVLVASALLGRKWGIGLAVLATFLREQFERGAWNEDSPARIVMGLAAFLGGSLFISELIQNRRVAVQALDEVKAAARAQSEAELEARALLDGSPAAVLTVDPDGNIATANDAACRLLGADGGYLKGQPVSEYLPFLRAIVTSKHVGQMMRTMLEGSGRRRSGESFFAQIWVSTYRTSVGLRLAVIVSDATEQLRDREETGLRQLLTNSRIIAAAVSHEVRNLSAAAAVLHGNLGKNAQVCEVEDYAALGRVLDRLREISTAEVPASAEEGLEGVDVGAVLHQLRMILSPGFQELGIEIQFEVSENLPRVHANQSGVLQVFLNLSQNARRALVDAPSPRLKITAYQLGDAIVVRFADNGPGVPASETLFQPFQTGAAASGLGLYVSRAIIRTFGGELYYSRYGAQTWFIVELPVRMAARSAIDD